MTPSSAACHLLALLLGVPGCNANVPTATEPVAFDSARAWADLETVVALGPRPPASEALERTRVYIEEQLARVGLQPVREPFTAQTPLGAIEMQNVYFDLAATEGGDEPPIVILCAHIDTKVFDFEFVGANDGGSGTAVLMELARSIAGRESRPVEYRFLFVDGEEALRTHWAGIDNTYGSRWHAERLLQDPRYERFKAVVLIDMVGDKDLQLIDDMNSDPEIKGLFFDAARANGLGKHVGGRREPVKDDHLSFMRIEIPSIDLIDLEYGPENSFWHSPEDTLDKCSRESLDAIGRIVLHGLAALEQKLSGS